MPSLFDVAKHFDDISIYDAYTNAFLFKGQFSNFLESSADGTIAQRRTMSLAPGIVVPTRRCIKALDTISIVGQGNVDGIFDTVIRQSFWTKKALASYNILTPAQAVLGQTGIVAYGHAIYEKETTNTATESEFDPFWVTYFSPSEGVTRGNFLKSGDTLYKVRSAHLEADGLTAALSDELDPGARVTVSFTDTGAYNPVTDSYTATNIPADAILVDRYKWYARLTEADDHASVGDMTLVVADVQVHPKVGQTVVVNVSIDDWYKYFTAAYSRAWVVHAATYEFDAWMLHIRRA